MTGGTFSISNGGVFGSMLSTPIINPPQSAILGVHATKDRAVVENRQVVVRPINYLAMSYDHRIIDGREAVLGLVAMKEALEDPLLFEIRPAFRSGRCSTSDHGTQSAIKQFDVVVIGGGPWRLHRGHPRGASWASTPPAPTSGRTTRAARHRRHLHQRRLHPVQGAAAVVRALRARRRQLRRARHWRWRVSWTWPKMVARRTPWKQNNDGILYLFKKNKVSFFHGRGSFREPVEGGYESPAGATRTRRSPASRSSSPRLQRRARCPAPFDEDKVLSTTARLRIGAVPKKLGVIGSGVIGLEMGLGGAAWAPR